MAELDGDKPSIDPQHVQEELHRQLATTIRYAMKQGMTETQIRRIAEQTLNEAR